MREISSIAKERLEKRLKVVEEQITVTSEELETARAFGDLSENSEYTAALSKYIHLVQEKAKIEYLLSNSVVKEGYSNSISIGSLISVKLIKSDTEVEDLGLLLFEEEGSALFDGTISPNSPLGREIQGGLSGDYFIQDIQGHTIKFRVTLEPESRISEYLEKYPPDREIMFDRIFSGRES